MTSSTILDELAVLYTAQGGSVTLTMGLFYLALAVVLAVLAVLVFVFAYRSRHTSPTSPYTLARSDAKVARLGYYSMQQGKRVAPEPHTVSQRRESDTNETREEKESA